MPYDQIDKAKWDECVANSRNRLIYGFSFYLDNMAVNWDGLVLNDYEAVMPLPWKKKFQIKYMYQPSFVQQGGIFSHLVISPEITTSFIHLAAEHFSFAEITLNFGNDVRDLTGKVKLCERCNYVLQLENYQAIFQNYDYGFRKSLRRIKKFNLHYKKSDDYSFVISLFKELYGRRLPSFKVDDYNNFNSVCSFLQRKNKVITRLALNDEGNVIAALVLLEDGNRMYNLLSCITIAGKKVAANDFLYDNIIEEFSNKGVVLDLEGSDVKGIADYYKKLNPTMEPYFFLKYNKLHPVLKMFKK